MECKIGYSAKNNYTEVAFKLIDGITQNFDYSTWIRKNYPADADEETKKQWAVKFVEEFANKGKPAALSYYNDPGFEFDSEVYRLTREKFDDEE